MSACSSLDPYGASEVSHVAALAIRQLQAELAKAQDTIETLQVNDASFQRCSALKWVDVETCTS